MSDSPQSRPPVLRVSYRSAGQFLVSYCTNLCRGAVFVRTQEPFAVDTRVDLALNIPDTPMPTMISAQVKWQRSEPSEFGPPGMGLVFEHIEDLLGEAIDHLVTTADPLMIDVVGCSSVQGNHLSSLLTSLVRCEVEHVDYGPQLQLACEQSDLIIIDLQRDTQLALNLVDHLAQSPNSPPTVILAPPMHDSVRDQAAKSARIVETPVDRKELQRAVLESVAQISWFEVKAAPEVKESPAADEADEAATLVKAS